MNRRLITGYLVILALLAAAFTHADTTTESEAGMASPPAATDPGPKDEETIRYEAGLRSLNEQAQFKAQENAITANVFLFQTSPPDHRARLWEELEKGRQTAEETRKKEAEHKPAPVNPDYDAETLRYMAAVEELGLPADMVEDLVEMFHSNETPFRETLWQRVRESPLKRQ